MADRISKTVYPSLRFPRQPLPPHPPALDLPLEMIPDFRPEQAFLKSIRPFLTSRGPDEPSAKDDDETSALKAFDWGHETLDIDWRGIFRLALKAQVYQPFVVAVCTFFGSLAFKTTSTFLRTFIQNNLIR